MNLGGKGNVTKADYDLDYED